MSINTVVAVVARSGSSALVAWADVMLEWVGLDNGGTDRQAEVAVSQVDLQKYDSYAGSTSVIVCVGQNLWL